MKKRHATTQRKRPQKPKKRVRRKSIEGAKRPTAKKAAARGAKRAIGTKTKSQTGAKSRRARLVSQKHASNQKHASRRKGKAMEKSLYEQLGGQAAVDAVVETFYRAVLSDNRISEFFDDVDMDRQIAKQKAFLTMVFGGPAAYTGKDLRTAHAHLVERGMNGTHFNVVVELLANALKEHGVSDAHIQQIAGIAGSVRKDVLNQ